MKISNIENTKRLSDEIVYNLNIEDNHNYYANGILVSNCHTFKRENKLDDFFGLVSTRNRFLFTGTLPDSPIDQWNLIGKSGPIIHDVERTYLVENKFITDADVRVIKIKYKDVPSYNSFTSRDDNEDENSPTSNYQIEQNFIFAHPFRNNIIRKIVERVDKNILITVDRIIHGETLYKHFKETITGKQIYFIRGKTEDEEREEIKRLMELNNNIICIAISRIFSTGINIKNLHYIVFASTGKAKIKTIQTIGRGVRPLDGKSKVVIFDISDMLYYGTLHVEKRLLIYEEENIKFRTTEIIET